MESMTPFCLGMGLNAYFPLPRAILNLSLSNTAILMYALLLDRGTLSQKRGYADEGGQVYVIYTIAHLAQALHRGTTVTKKGLKELEQAGLIRREHSGWNRPSRIFLYVPKDCFRALQQVKNDSSKGRKTDCPWDGFPPANNHTKQTYFNDDSYQLWEDESL